MSEQGVVSIIVPAWRGGTPPPVASLIRALADTVTTAHEIVVVCNGQDAALVDYLRSEPAVTRTAFLTENVGVARGWNIGAHMACGEFLVFINEDAVPGKGCVDALAAALASNPGLGIVGPRGTWWALDASSAQHAKWVSGTGLVACDVVSGFFFALRSEALKAAGFFDDALSPCSWEEMDIAQAVRRLGLSVCALGGLDYQHEFGVSAWGPDREIAWLGKSESTAAIWLRNHARIVRKWADTVSFDGRRHDVDHVVDAAYVETMTKPRTVNGRTQPPLVEKLADVIEATGLLPAGGRVLDVGRSSPVLVEELLKRGYDAWGLYAGTDAIPDNSVRDRLRHENPLDMRTDVRYDLAFADDLYEHLNDAEARLLTQRIRAVSDHLVVIINKSRHEPSHINIKSNREWLMVLADCGFGFEPAATARARARYLRTSAGTEAWHLNLLALTTRSNTAFRRLFARTIADATPAWWVAGALKALR